MTGRPLTAGLGTGRVTASAGRRLSLRRAAPRVLAFLAPVVLVLYFLVFWILVYPVRLTLAEGGRRRVPGVLWSGHMR